MKNIYILLLASLAVLSPNVSYALVDSTNWYITSTDFNNDNGSGGTLGQDVMNDINYYVGTGGLVVNSSGSCVSASSYRCEASDYAAYCFTQDVCGAGKGRWMSWTWTDCPTQTTTCEMTAAHDPPDEPAECSDGVVSGDEAGYDCGGSCTAECGCPSGTTEIYIPNGDPPNRCAFYTAAIAGNCPAGYQLVQDNAVEGEECYALEDGFGYMYPVDDSPTVEAPPGFAGGTFNIVESTDVTEVDNGDGTTTVTTVTTETAGQGTTNETITTTTITRIINNTTGGTISEDVVKQTDIPPEENYDNYSWDGVNTNIYDGDITADLPVKEDNTSLFDSFFNTSPLFSALDSFEVQTSNAECSINLGTIYEKDMIVNFCDWESHLVVAGTLLLSIVQAFSLLVVYRGWK